MTSTEYPPPTVSMTRRLYGCAFRCARPDCSRPLYRLDDETGDRVLNSRISHIHARRQGGPRWVEMPPEDNRAFENLLLLCIDHSYEIDEFPERFPVETLRAWKSAQLAEYDKVQQNWLISEDEAAEVLAASDSFSSLYAPAMVDLVRRVEALRLLALRTRSGPRKWAESWQTLRRTTRAGFSAWDEDGNPVYVEPSEFQVRPLREGLCSALAETYQQVAVAADAARVELAAVKATRPQVQPWCDALGRAIDTLLEEAGGWHRSDDLTDDAAFGAAVLLLEETASDLVQVVRGENVPLPQVPPVVTEEPTVDPLAEHMALLEEARPYARVTHRPYDPELRERIAQGTETAAYIPPVPGFMPIDLHITAGLAVDVARNADETELLRLIELDKQRTPLCAAVALLVETARDAEDWSLPQVATSAWDRLRELWRESDWTDALTWADSSAYGSMMLCAFARATSDDEVKQRLADALVANPAVLVPLVTACAGWSESVASDDWTNVTERRRSYCSMPPDFLIPSWLPVDTIRALYAGPSPATDDDVFLNAVLRETA